MTQQIHSCHLARPSHKQHGNALLYTLLALVLGGIGLAVGVGQYQEAERSTSVQASVGEITSIIGAAKQNFGQYNYAGLDTAAAVRSQVIPQSLATTATEAANKFGGAVTLLANNANTPGTALLTYEGVPSNVCTSLINGTQALARRIAVGTTAVKPLDEAVNIGGLTAQCNSAATVSIAWTIGRT